MSYLLLQISSGLLNTIMNEKSYLYRYCDCIYLLNNIELKKIEKKSNFKMLFCPLKLWVRYFAGRSLHCFIILRTYSGKSLLFKRSIAQCPKRPDTPCNFLYFLCEKNTYSITLSFCNSSF